MQMLALQGAPEKKKIRRMIPNEREERTNEKEKSCCCSKKKKKIVRERRQIEDNFSARPSVTEQCAILTRKTNLSLVSDPEFSTRARD